jgi:hypothetical protein
MKKSSTKEILFVSSIYAGLTMICTFIGFAILGFIGVFKYSQTPNE